VRANKENLGADGGREQHRKQTLPTPWLNTLSAENPAATDRDKRRLQ
jgi:hypothetical protein